MIFAGLTKSIFTIETDRLTATPAYDLINTLPQIPDGHILAGVGVNDKLTLFK